MNKKKASFICFLVWFTGIILLIVADQAAKYWAVSKLKGTSGMTLITGVLELQYLENRGMAFGMLQGTSDAFSCTVHSFLRCNVVAFLQNSQNRILHSTDSGRWYSDRRCGRKFY